MLREGPVAAGRDVSALRPVSPQTRAMQHTGKSDDMREKKHIKNGRYDEKHEDIKL